MPYRNILNIKWVDGVSMASSVTSSVIDLSNTQGLSIHAFWTGSPSGSFQLEASDDAGAHWAVYQDSIVALPVIGNSIFWNVSEVHFDQIRLVYTAASGSGTLTAWINCKGDDN